MSMHLYFSLIPEALIASMLPPEQFGQYYATGPQVQVEGAGLVLRDRPVLPPPVLRHRRAASRAVPKPDGTPKNSVYISMYRVLEHLQMAPSASST
jgi:hypothetical protein